MSSNRRARYWAAQGHDATAAQNLADIARDHIDWDDARVIAQHQFEMLPVREHEKNPLTQP